MKLDAREIKAEAQGRWQDILAAIGIPAKSLTNKHQPCPACGGKDRFRFDDMGGNGTFICNQYDRLGGDGIALVMHYLDCDFQTALREIAAVLGMDGSSGKAAIKPPAYRADTKPTPTDKLPELAAIWEQAAPIEHQSPVIAYLTGRGLGLVNDLPQSVRYADSLPYWYEADGKAGKLGCFPVMLAAIRDTDGELHGLHRTYLQADNGTFRKLAARHPETGRPLDSKKMQGRYTGSISGCAVHLYPMPASGRLMVAEGIETALAARELFADGALYGLWAALSANGLERLILPSGLTELAVIADKDSTGYKAAHDLAIRAIKGGISVKMWCSDTEGFDALEELNSKQGGNHDS